MNKKLCTKIVCIVAVLILVCGAVGFGVFEAVKKASKNKPLTIGFYNVSEKIETSLSKLIEESWEGEVVFREITQKELGSKKFNNNYDLVFSWEGNLTEALKDSAKTILKKSYEVQPSSFRNKQNGALNILLNHYEIAYNKQLLSQVGMEYPENFAQFEAFLESMEQKVFCPFICEGSNDEVLINFIGSLFESYAGTAGYNEFAKKVQKASSFEDLLDDSVASGVSLRQLLDMLKTWPKKGYTHPAWMNATKADINLFMEQDQVAVVYTSLEEHRKMAYQNVEKYEACRFPIENEKTAHGVIAPAVVCTKTNNRFDLDKLIYSLVVPENQETLSYETELAPVSSRGQAYDRQADDVRFFAAACNDGPLPDLYASVYQMDNSTAHTFAENIRNYLK